MSKQVITPEMLQTEYTRCMKEVTESQLEVEEKDVETTMILEYHAFFAQVLMQCRKEFTLDMPYAAGVTIKNARWYLLIGAPFLCKYHSYLNKVGILVHEVEHIVRRHLTRQQTLGIKVGSSDFELWKIAADLEINQPPVLNIPSPPLALHYSMYQLPEKQSVEQYYHALKEVQEEQESEYPEPQGGADGNQEQESNGQDQDDGTQDQSGNSPTEGDSPGKPTQMPDTDSQGRNWLPRKGKSITVVIGSGEPVDGTKSPVNKNWDKMIEEAGDPVMIDEMAKEIINEAIKRTQGKFPSHLQEAISELNKPHKIPWTTMLRRYISNAIMKVHSPTWTRYNKRLPYLDMKGKKRNKGVNIVFVWDTSGSIRHEEIDQAFAELKGMAKTKRLAEIWVVQCDADVQWTGLVKDVPMSKEIEIHGRGGTDFRPAFQWVEDTVINPDVMVFMTDGYGDYPEEEPNYPVIWLKVKGANIGVEWGLQIEYPKPEKK